MSYTGVVMDKPTFTQYRVEYRSKFSDNREWQPRTDKHSTLQAAFDELAHISDCRDIYDFRIVKRLVTDWEVVE